MARTKEKPATANNEKASHQRQAPAFNCVKMAWVAGLGLTARAAPLDLVHLLHERCPAAGASQDEGVPPGLKIASN